MLLKRFTNYLLAHPWKALGFTFLVTFIPIVGVIGILIAALFTLLKGPRQGALFTGAASLPYIISFIPTFVQHHGAYPLMLWAAVVVAVFSNLSTYGLAVMLYRKSSFSSLLQVSALAGVLIISVIHLLYPDVADWWALQLKTSYTEAHLAMKGVLSKSVEIPTETINITKQYATGLMISGILFNAILQLLVALWWEAVIFKPGNLANMLHNVRLTRLAGILFVTSLICSYLGNRVVLDIMPILYMLFAAAGLSLIHFIFGLVPSKMAWFWLAVLYMMLIFSMPMSLMLLSMLALLDIGLDLRKRFRKV